MAWFRRRSPDPDPPPPAPAPPSFATDRELVVHLAEQHLPPEHVEAWVSLLAPAVALVPLDEAPAGAPVCARLGGTPSVPAGFDWPVWEGHGPLAYVGELLLEPLAGLDTGLDLPAEGRLLLFYFDGSYDDFDGVVGSWEPESTRQGARLVHVVGTGTPHPAPERVEVFDEVELAGREIVTVPGWEHPALKARLAPQASHEEWMAHPVHDDDLAEALDERFGHARHQVGGYAFPVQGPVEDEVASAALDGQGDDAAVTAEAARWRLLVQVDSDDAAGMMWGDAGLLYWLVRGDLSQVGFTWQCS
jgi:uncharacterized protein YwqG